MTSKRQRERTAATAVRRVRLFKNGRSQAVRIPREFQLSGDEVVIRRNGRRLVIEPAPRRSLSALLDSWAPLTPDDDFPEIVRHPAEPFDL